MKDGILPNNGGWLEQTNKFCEVMDFIDKKVLKEIETNAKHKRT